MKPLCQRREFLFQCCAALAVPRLAVAGRSSAAKPVERATRFLLDRQQDDGSWRSSVYGAFKDGRALTPLVTLALDENISYAQKAMRKARAWIRANGEPITEVFPVHNAAWLLQLTDKTSPQDAELRRICLKRLKSLQLGDAHGWKLGHAYHGGWSYAPFAPEAGKDIAPFQQPNLSATVLALEGLRAGGTPADSSIIRDARRFIERCQNYSTMPSTFDDGGFFQLKDDPNRNKAGSAGQDGAGRTRQRSYTSATADGLRGLLMCGCESDNARVKAAIGWMDKHLDVDDVPDLRHYASYAVVRADKLAQKFRGPPAWSREVQEELTEQQRADGSWHNAAGEMRENDPIVATALALLALPSR